MKFKGNIIITDPCYIIKECLEENPYPCPWDKKYMDSPYRDELIKQYKKWEDAHNDWKKCESGQNMKALGISHYICADTIYGDWSCTAYKITEDPYKVIDSFVENGKDCGVNYHKLGNFCADVGMVAVFDLDEVRKYNPNIDEWIASHNWCITTITDFDGEVNYHIDKQGYAHIIGIGNINFFTVQTGI